MSCVLIIKIQSVKKRDLMNVDELQRIIVFYFANATKDINVKIYIDQFTLFAFLATGLANWHSSAFIGEVESLTLKK